MACQDPNLHSEFYAALCLHERSRHRVMARMWRGCAVNMSFLHVRELPGTENSGFLKRCVREGLVHISSAAPPLLQRSVRPKPENFLERILGSSPLC
jgi:hypothetical protein